jgi:Fic family protein
MDELAAGLNDSPVVDGIVEAAMTHLNLVMVHPFRDGNGRMARALQSLVLARDGVLSPVFMSIEEYLGRNTEDYYRVLAEVGDGSWNPARDARPWIRFNLTAHLRQASIMSRRIDEAERLWDGLEHLVAKSGVPERSIHALYDAAMGWRVRRSMYQSVLEHAHEAISDQAATRDLKALVDAGLLVPRGEKRGRFYVGGASLMELREQALRIRSPKDESDPFAGVS